MTQDKAKTAVNALFYLQWAKERVEDTPCIVEINEALELLRPLAAGTHIIVPVDPTEAMIEAWSISYPTAGQEFNDKSCATVDWQAMLTASQKEQ